MLTVDTNGCLIFSSTPNPANRHHNGTDNILKVGNIENPTSIIVNSNYRIIEGYGAILASDGENCPQIRIHTCRNAVDKPQGLVNGDYVTHFIALGHTGKEYETVAGFRVDVVGEVTETSIPGVFTISVGNYMNNKDGIQNFHFYHDGNFLAPSIRATEKFTPPIFDDLKDLEKNDWEEGNLVYIKSQKRFYGYDGSIWKGL
ncbi:MAG: hypothetical protein EBX50_09615 [Chitinophagia bacterium]|nr:hypothetical protein [Chitinophagia bacterium]